MNPKKKKQSYRRRPGKSLAEQADRNVLYQQSVQCVEAEIDMVDENEPFEIEHGGNAFMMIRRDCFETLKPHTPIYTNGGRSLPDGVEIKDYFRVEINKDTNHLLSEDYLTLISSP